VIIREQIVQAVMARLAPLTTVPVLRREQYEDESEFVCVWDQTQETSRDDYGRLTHAMDLTVEFIRQDASGYASPAAAVSGMYGDLVLALFNDPATGEPDPTFAGLADNMTESSMIPLTPEAGLRVVGLSLQVEITYHTKHGDPFSQ
jgi:hypothetical protein